jgi:subtilisin family serine protease
VRPHGGAGAAHGTAVAGIIFARHSNGQGIAGVAPEAQIIVTRIANDFGSFALDQYIADAIRCAWFTWGADILNNSWTGGPPDPNISGAIVAGSLLGRGGKGSLFVAAAGNDLETVGYPANIPQMLAVNAITRSGALPSYAAPTGMTTTDLVAPSKGEPGEQYGVITTDVATSGDGYDPTSGYFMYFGGTSAAAPQVSGAAALVLPRFSTLNRFDLNARLASTAESWGPSATFGAGKVDASSAADVSELHAYVTGEEYIFSKGSYTWTASPSGGIQSYSYRWRKRSVGGHGLSSAGVQSVNQVVYGGDSDFDLELRVISGGQTTYSTVRVVNCIGVPNCVPI